MAAASRRTQIPPRPVRALPFPLAGTGIFGTAGHGTIRPNTSRHALQSVKGDVMPPFWDRRTPQSTISSTRACPPPTPTAEGWTNGSGWSWNAARRTCGPCERRLFTQQPGKRQHRFPSKKRKSQNHFSCCDGFRWIRSIRPAKQLPLPDTPCYPAAVVFPQEGRKLVTGRSGTHGGQPGKARPR